MSQRVSLAIRRMVQTNAKHRCEYCRKPEKVSVYSFHVDHIRPLIHGGNSDLENLAWACFECNVTKGSNIASYDELNDTLTPLYNPRKQIWDEHFKLDGAIILGITPEGRVTVRLLQMNDPAQLEIRENLLAAGQW